MTPSSSDTARLNIVWARRALRALIAAGVRHCVVCPGSRSAPLVVAASEFSEALSIHVHYDERGAAFLALGLSLGSDAPVMIITTSGTAVANVLPAVVEASLSHVPLIICSADRPPERRDTEANQAVDQVHMMGRNARWFFEVPCPTADLLNAEAFIDSTMRQAVRHAVAGDPGPVHLNFMFREPLVPSPADMPSLPEVDHHPVSTVRPAVATGAVPEDVQKLISGATRGVMLVGQLSNEHDREAVRQLGRSLGWPIMADITSGLKCRDSTLPLIQYSDLLLRDERLAARLNADVILHIGGRWVSKSLLRYLEAAPLEALIRFQCHPRRSDPTHRATHCCVGEVASLCQAVDVSCCSVEAPWVDSWRLADQRVSDALSEWDDGDGFDEFSLARHLSHVQPASHDLFLSNSLPIREFDMVGRPLPSGVAVHANRGASGIDGIVASAAGCARGRGRPMMLVIGDQTLLYDLNSLSLLKHGPPLTVVVFNNDGGGIFETLPIAQHGDVFERFFAAPHGYTFEGAAAMFGVDYARAETRAEFNDRLQECLSRPRSGIIEVSARRQETRERMDVLGGLTRGLDL